MDRLTNYLCESNSILRRGCDPAPFDAERTRLSLLDEPCWSFWTHHQQAPHCTAATLSRYRVAAKPRHLSDQVPKL